MKKILTGLFILIIFSNNYVYGEVYTAASFVSGGYSVNIQKNISKDSFLRFYQIDSKNIKAGFNNLSRDSEKNFLKTLTKEEKKNYKLVKKIQKLILEEKWGEVFSKYPDFFPAYIQYYDYYHSKNDYKKALPVLVKVNEMNKKYQVLEQNSLDYNLAVLYFYNSQYATALSYFKKLEPVQDESIISAIADCYYYTGSYYTAINYLKKLKVLDYHNKETLYACYYVLHNKSEANKYAHELLNEIYSYSNLLKVIKTTSDNSAKLSYAYKARGLTSVDEEILEVNKIISELEQAKLNKKAAGMSQFVKIPQWSEIVRQLPKNIEAVEISTKQDEFFKNANLYFSRYKGAQLTNAFNSLNQDFNNYIQLKQNEYYQQKQLEAQKAIIEEQQRNNIIQQQLLYEQQVRNNLERQHFYYMSRPYYYHRGYYGWWW